MASLRDTKGAFDLKRRSLRMQRCTLLRFTAVQSS